MRNLTLTLMVFLLLAVPVLAQHGTPQGPPTTTVLGLASYAVKGKIAAVTDGTSATDCTVGGGSTAVLCQYSGTAWASVGGSMGANAALSNLTSPTAINQPLTFAGGASLSDNGSGGLNVNASGTNQNITLTPSGTTGNVVIPAQGPPSTTVQVPSYILDFHLSV